jgi:G3E family GTPase
LLNHLLVGEEGASTAVIINEFGEVSLDHLLVRSVAGSSVVLHNGCVCCVIRSDLRAALRDLITQREKTEGFEFGRIVIETTGLADPGPIAQTISSDPMLAAQLRLAGIVCTADAVHGAHQIDEHVDCLRQIAAADHLVITKADLVSEEALAAFVETIRSVNPLAEWSIGAEGLSEIVNSLMSVEVARRVPLRCLPAKAPTARHGGIRSIAIETDAPIDWTAFSVWLSAFIHCHGDRMLRLKGLLAIEGASTPVAFHVVRNHIHPPAHLSYWPDEADRTTRIVFIVKDVDISALKLSLLRFLGLKSRKATAGTGSDVAGERLIV